MSDPTYEELSSALGIVSAQNVKLEKQVADLKGAASRRNDWLWRMKARLGYDQSISFDRVMDDLIAGRHLRKDDKEDQG